MVCVCTRFTLFCISYRSMPVIPPVHTHTHIHKKTLCDLSTQDALLYPIVFKRSDWNRASHSYLWISSLTKLVLTLCVCVSVCVWGGCGCVWTQLCLILCDPIDGSLPGSSVLGISQARILEWVAISFSNRSSYLGIKPMSPVSSALQVDSLPLSPIVDYMLSSLVQTLN